MIVGGSSLSSSLKDSGKFSPHEYYSVQIGEETGELVVVLEELSKFFSKKINQRRQIITALSYPIIVLFVAIGAITFMMNFIVPMFASVFSRFGGELPAITKVIISISNFLSSNLIYIILALIMFILFTISQKRKIWFRKLSSMLLLKIPVIGKLISKIYLARFCSSMKLLINAKIPLVNAMDLMEKMIGFYPIECTIKHIRKDLMEGTPLYKSLAKFNIYSKRFTALTQVGEEVNQLDSIFAKLTSQYSDEVDHQTKLLSSFIEPVILIFLGLFVGLILIAMYLPLFQMSSSFQ